MRYTYIKLTDEQVVLKWISEDAEHNDHFTAELASEDTPEPEFVNAFRGLATDLLGLCELPRDLLQGLQVRTLSLRHNTQKNLFGVVISGARTLENSSRPLVITSPLFNQPTDDSGYGKKGILPQETEKKILGVLQLADAFRKGDRAQQELPLVGSKKTGRGTGDLTPIEAAIEAAMPKEQAGVPLEDLVAAVALVAKPIKAAADMSNGEIAAAFDDYYRGTISEGRPVSFIPFTTADGRAAWLFAAAGTDDLEPGFWFDVDREGFDPEAEDSPPTLQGAALIETLRDVLAQPVGSLDGSGAVAEPATPFDDEIEEERTYRPGEVPAGDDAEANGRPFATPLTVAPDINPTMIAILSDAGIRTLQDMARAGRGAVSQLKGLGPKKLQVLDAALRDHELAWVDTTNEEDAAAEPAEGPEAEAVGAGEAMPA